MWNGVANRFTIVFPYFDVLSLVIFELDTDAGHQTLLVEDEGIDVGLAGQGCQILAGAGVDDHDARANAHFPALAF